jgi:hypothetical protein
MLVEIVRELRSVLSVPAPATPYLRGDRAASEYLGLNDPQGRTFRKWANKHRLQYSMIGSVRTYRKTDIDRIWQKTAFNRSCSVFN